MLISVSNNEHLLTIIDVHKCRHRCEGSCSQAIIRNNKRGQEPGSRSMSSHQWNRFCFMKKCLSGGRWSCSPNTKEEEGTGSTTLETHWVPPKPGNTPGVLSLRAECQRSCCLFQDQLLDYSSPLLTIEKWTWCTLQFLYYASHLLWLTKDQLQLLTTARLAFYHFFVSF